MMGKRLMMTLFLSLQTGVKGEYVRGKLVRGRGVRVVGQRCRVSGGREHSQGGLMHLMLREEGRVEDRRGRRWWEGEWDRLEAR